MDTRFGKLFAWTRAKKKQQKATHPNGLTCQEVVELVTEYLEDTLLPEKQTQFEEHVAGCEGCTNYFEQVRLTLDMLRDLAKEPVFPETRESLRQVFRQWKNQQEG